MNRVNVAKEQRNVGVALSGGSGVKVRRPSMKDVGDLAGVSHQTVSRFLNSPQLLTDKTRSRVAAAIDELGFTQNMAARALVTNRSHLIGVLMPRDGLFGPVSTGVAIADAARASGYATTQVAVPEDLELIKGITAQLRRLRVDGLIIVRSTVGLDSVTHALSQEFPVAVITGAPLESPECGVHVSHRESSREVVEHLFAVGCRSVAHLAGPSDWFDARERALGWEEAVRGRGDCELVQTGSWGSEAGYEAAKLLLRGDRRPDGIFAANDLIALGAIRAARELAIDLPTDLAIAGFDAIAGSEFFQPALTSVVQPFEEAGRSSVDLLISVLRGEEPQVVSYRPRLVIRESTSGFQRGE